MCRKEVRVCTEIIEVQGSAFVIPAIVIVALDVQVLGGQSMKLIRVVRCTMNVMIDTEEQDIVMNYFTNVYTHI